MACSTPQPPGDDASALVGVSVAAEEGEPVASIAPAPPAESTAFDAAPVVSSAAVIDEANSIYFALRSARVDTVGQAKLRAIAGRLAGNRRATVLLIGYGDWQGSRSYDLALTEERLAAVSKSLRRYGVAAHQVRRNRVGSIRRGPDCTDEACWQRARRVELVVRP